MLLVFLGCLESSSCTLDGSLYQGHDCRFSVWPMACLLLFPAFKEWQFCPCGPRLICRLFKWTVLGRCAGNLCSLTVRGFSPVCSPGRFPLRGFQVWTVMTFEFILQSTDQRSFSALGIPLSQRHLLKRLPVLHPITVATGLCSRCLSVPPYASFGRPGG